MEVPSTRDPGSNPIQNSQEKVDPKKESLFRRIWNALKDFILKCTCRNSERRLSEVQVSAPVRVTSAIKQTSAAAKQAGLTPTKAATPPTKNVVLEMAGPPAKKDSIAEPEINKPLPKPPTTRNSPDVKKKSPPPQLTSDEKTLLDLGFDANTLKFFSHDDVAFLSEGSHSMQKLAKLDFNKGSQDIEFLKMRFQKLEKLDEQLKARNEEHFKSSPAVIRNGSKCRYANILPYEWSGFYSPPGLTDEFKQVYFLNSTPELKFGNNSYVALNAPPLSGYDDFFSAIYLGKISTVVALGKAIDNGRIKMDAYWEKEGKELEFTFYKGKSEKKEFSITVTSSMEGNIIVREFTLTDKANKEPPHSFKQFHFTEWPDHGVAEPAQFYSMLDLVNKNQEGKQAPAFVHCSAGVGRSGVFIAAHSIINEEKETVNLDTRIMQMRLVRPSMVQTEDQYVFTHQLLKYHYDQKDVKSKPLLPARPANLGQNKSDDAKKASAKATQVSTKKTSASAKKVVAS